MSTKTRMSQENPSRGTERAKRFTGFSQKRLTRHSYVEPNSSEMWNRLNYATQEDTHAKERRISRFQDQQTTWHSRNPRLSSSDKWNKNGVTGESHVMNRQKKIQSEIQDSQPVVRLGKATGTSRTPDVTLANSPQLIQKRLSELLERSKRLENDLLTALNIDERNDMSTQLSTAALKEWEAILGDFRQLTMAVTASGLREVKNMAISVYEGAADASLLAGNLSFYLSCQSRLLSDLYNEYSMDSNSTAADRRDEFIGYSLLYFGVFCEDALELAVAMRRMNIRTMASPSVKFSLSLVSAFRNGENTKFISMFNLCNLRQKTILRPSMHGVRRSAFTELVRSYLALERNCAVLRLGMKSEIEFLQLLESERPDLKSRNFEHSAEFYFRLPRVT